ncbi:Coiled-coil domain-containing protein 57 [Borealophlyctis nickersoniae]|nr:Coiled-coil domain-containing protein 57 [Borealophlyctis nickersoniae]
MQHPVELPSLPDLLSQREKELRDIYATLEQKIKEKDAEDDFVYNLKLLEDRDKELEQYDVATEGLKSEVHESETRINDLRLLLNEKVTELSQLKTLLQTQEQHHNEAIRRMRREQETLQQQHEDAILARVEEYEQSRMEIQLQLRAANQETEIQRDAFAAELDRIKRQHEIDLRVCKQEMNHQLLDAEHRVASAFAEANAAKMARETVEGSLRQQLEINKTLEKKLREVQWEHSDAEKTAAGRILELEEQLRLAKLELSDATMQFEEERKRMILDWEAKDQMREHEKEVHQKKLAQTVAKLEAVAEENRLQSSQLESRLRGLEDVIRLKDQQRQKLQAELNATRTNLEENAQMHQHQIFQRDAELSEMRKNVAGLEDELAERRRDISLYKEDIARRIKVEQELRQACAEEQLEWERKLDDLRRRKLRDQDDLMRSLIMAKDKAEAQVKNQHLSEVIHQMRQDMETLQHAMTSVAEQQSEHHGTDHRRTHIEQDLGNTEMYHQEAIHLHAQLARLQTLLQQKQTLIDQLLEQQEQMHAKLNHSLQQQTRKTGKPPSDDPTVDEITESALEELREENEMLRAKLRSAVADLFQAAKERSRLVDMSNSLRAELRRLTEKDSDNEMATHVQQGKKI